MRLLPLLLVAFGLAGCPRTDSDVPPTPQASGCDPLDPSVCLFPYPSSLFLVDDPAMPTGRRVAYGPTALPLNVDGVQLDPGYWNEKDGYSISSQMLFWFADASDAGLVRWDEVERYADADAPTVIVDLTTGERVPHFAELDASADDDDERAYVLRPVVPLEYGRHYAVGVRGLVTTSGATIPPSDAFRSLRDDEPGTDPDVESRRQRFDDVVFPGLQAAGVPRDELQLAWDFHTHSRENSLGKMIFMRDHALASVGADGPAYTVASVEDNDCAAPDARIARTVEIRATAPLYTVDDGPGTVLTRGDDGMPVQNGETTFDVVVRIPCSVMGGGGPKGVAPGHRVLQYGHGLLGSRDEARTGWLAGLAHDAGWVIAATDWTGMSEDDIGDILLMSAEDPSRFAIIPERSMQGMVHQLLVLPLLRGPLANDPSMLDANGVSVISPDRASWYGNSQGAIMGGAFMALTQEIDRGVLGVSGANYGLTLTRSKDFDFYFLIFKTKFDDDRDIALLVQGLVQQLWDPAEGAGYLWAMNRDPLPNTPPKDILIHTAIGDNQVTTLGGQLQARAYGARLVTPTPRDVFAVEEVPGGFSGSALVEWSYPDAAPENPANTPPEGPDPHECPRREPAGMVQIRDFLETGVVNQPCEGVCGSTIAETCPG